MLIFSADLLILRDSRPKQPISIYLNAVHLNFWPSKILTFVPGKEIAKPIAY